MLKRALLATLLLVAPAHAAAPWSEPVSVSRPATFVDDPFVGFGADGRPITTWRAGNGVGTSSTGGFRVGTLAPSGPERSAPELASRPELYATGALVSLTRASTSDPSGQGIRLGATFGRTNGTFDPPRRIATYRGYARPALAANARGAAVAAFIAFRSPRSSDRLLRVSLRAAGGRFATPTTIRGNGRIDAVTAAIGPRGDLVVAYARDGRLEARVRRAGHGFGSVQDLGPTAKGTATLIRAAVAASGRVYVAWATQQLSEGGPAGTPHISTAVETAGSSRCRAAVARAETALSPTNGATLALRATPAGDAVLVWSSAAASVPSVVIETTTPSATFTAARRFTDPQPVDVDVATGSDGRATVVWSTEDGRVSTTHRRAGAGFGPAESVAAPESARQPSVAYDPASGAPTVVWSARPGGDGPGVPLSRIQTFARASTRAAG